MAARIAGTGSRSSIGVSKNLTFFETHNQTFASDSTYITMSNYSDRLITNRFIDIGRLLQQPVVTTTLAMAVAIGCSNSCSDDGSVE